MIDAIVISHPDDDHYNSIASLMDRIPVGQVLMTTDFAKSGAAEVQYLLQTIATLKIPTVIAMHGDRVSSGELTIDFLQADFSLSPAYPDNEASLVAILNYRNRRICLPGDLEGGGQTQLLSVLPECDLLMSPHHGSPASNDSEFANAILPAEVVVSANKDRQVQPLQDLYAPARVFFTARDGAVTYMVRPDGTVSVETFVHSGIAARPNSPSPSD
jgi:competence protein ComEC